jgi:DNA modification methylase
VGVVRKRTTTSNFGAGKREGHDASGFYSRFENEAPELSDDATICPPRIFDEAFHAADARSMAAIADGEAALVVTSPPYFAGKQYEEELEREGIPSSYVEYLDLLYDVFAECKRILEPGGRIAVNVANLGRKPYRSLASDIVAILQELGLLLRGEIVWQKGEGANGSCAWGSFRSASNPVLRDTTERVVIASKGRFDRASTVKKREELGLPFRNTLTADEFMESTLDVWQLAPESARRVHHPAPFPIALPERLINLYTYENDLVVDPFLGSGTTLVAASRTGRRYVGYDLDPEYVAIARERVATEGQRVSPRAFEGASAAAIAARTIGAAGFTKVVTDRKVPGTGVTVAFVGEDVLGRPWHFELAGTHSSTRSGLTRADLVWRFLGRANVLRRNGVERLVLLTPELPKSGTEAFTALRACGPETFFDVISLFDDASIARLRTYANLSPTEPTKGFW